MNNNSTPGNHTMGTPSRSVLPEYARTIFYVVQGVLVLFGIGGNILVVLSVFCNTYLKKSISNLFIANLAISDIFVLAVSHSFILGLEIHEYQWHFGAFACEGLYPFSDSFFGVSIWSIVIISYHRYCGIVHTMRSKISRTKARLLLTATWIFSILIVTLPLWTIMKHVKVKTTYYCEPIYPNMSSKVAYLTTLNALFYVLPLTLIVYFYVRIRLTLQKSSGFHREMTKSSSISTLRDDVAKRIRGNTKALRLLTPVVIVFFVTMLPISLFRVLIIFTWMKTYKYTQVVFFACIISLLANSSANPLIYTIVSPEFRRSFLRFLGISRMNRGLTKNTDPYMTNVVSQGNAAAQNEASKDSDSMSKGNDAV